MEELSSQVLQGFGLKPRSVTKHKLFYICNTDKGTKLIKRMAAEEEKAKSSILFQHNIKEDLFSQGYKSLDRFNISIKNEPFYILDGSAYIATDYLPYRESNFSNADEFKNIVKNVAVMHSLAKSTAVIKDTNNQLKKNSIDDLYYSSLDKLITFKKNITKYKQLSDFDVLFYKNYDYYILCLDKWFVSIKKSKYEEMNNKAVQDGRICHNLLKEEYILINKNDIYITNFSECSYGHFLNDLTSIIKRHFKANTERPLCVTEIIDTYHKSNPLTKQDIELLYAMLIFPDKFIKICTQYYTKKRTWIPGAFKARMEQTIQTKDAYMKYIDRIYKDFLK